MDRSILLKDFKEAFKEQIKHEGGTYSVTPTRVEWSSGYLHIAWLSWVASYETYAATALGHLTGDYNSQE